MQKGQPDVVTIDHFEKRMDKLEDKMMNNFDKVMKQLEALSQDNEVGAFQAGELEEKVEDHEKRILHLEHSQKSA